MPTNPSGLLQVSELDREKLKIFVTNIYRFIGQLIVEGGPYSTKFFRADFLDNYRPAWEEFEQQLPLSEALKRIDIASNDDLKKAGLYGAQLRLKLSVVDRLKNLFDKFGTSYWLKKLLEAIDIMLKSIISAAGLDGALDELKEYLEISIDDEEDQKSNKLEGGGFVL